ncbi:C-C chemokine receptor type 5 isoform X1 [Danio rerio]|uniref:C-C chemokine receptor type 5 isoform X1 n=1 Tax=Danio rerio TaxID=7955 RepID=A0A8M1REM0_DANRE|nr:C-C chemokine receptor type 5-like [Danio rerio]|eukprot:XP_002667428.3 C-C chemokine receptor type 5-like [Danio rerio]
MISSFLSDGQRRFLKEQFTTPNECTDDMMHEDMSYEVFNFSYDDYYLTYEYPLIVLEEGNSLFGKISAICYSLIVCMGLPGNLFLLWLVLKKVGLSSSADCLLLHLTISDLVFTLTLIPWTIYHIRGWIFGFAACRLFSWFIFLGLYSYMLFLTVMTVHRYIAVQHPVFASSVGNRGRLYAHVSSAVVWMISLGFSLPEMIFSETLDRYDGVQCVSYSRSEFWILFGYFSQIILFFLLPFLVIALCYARMGFTIHQSRIRSRNRHHAVCLILSIAIGFFICWAPYNIFLFIHSLEFLGVVELRETLSDTVYCVTHILAYFHCCLNPLVHIFGGKKYRNFLPWSRRVRWLPQSFSNEMFSSQSSFSGQFHL